MLYARIGLQKLNRTIQHCPSRLPSELIELLAKQGDVRRFSADELLIAEGDVSDTLYLLVSGQLKVFTDGPKDRELVYNVLEPGEVFGEMFLDGETRSASVMSIVDSQCVLIEGDRIRDLIRAHPDFAEYLITKLISRIRQATKAVRSLALESVYERTAALLDDLAITAIGSRRLPAGITQAEIANRIGATREMVNHVLRDLTRGGFIAREGRQIVIVKKLPKRW